MKGRFVILLIIPVIVFLITIYVCLFRLNSENPREYIYKKALQYEKSLGQTNVAKELMKIADFLLDNMSSHNGMPESSLEFNLKFYKAWIVTSKSISELTDSIENKDRQTFINIADTDAIDKELLWRYVLDMYKFRNSSKICNKFNSDVFLEFIVPYRVGNEPLNLKWRSEADSTLKAIMDSIANRDKMNILETANLAMKVWNTQPFKWTDGLPKECTLGVKSLTVKAGNCRDFGVGAIFMMRYLGIPSGMDFIFAREGENSSHFWPFILDDHNNTFYANQDIPYWTPSRQLDIPATKIYRMSFSVNTLLNDNDASDLHNIHPRFINRNIIDVTNEYREVFHLEIPVSESSLHNNSVVYICNAMRNHWAPVGIGNYKNGKACFKNIASSTNACIIAKWDSNGMKPITQPFVLDSVGNIRYFSIAEYEEEAHIFCKYPLSSKNGDVVDRMIGGRIEGSNTIDFTNSELIYKISSSPVRKINRVSLSSIKPYRYVRYIGADSSYCNIAELEIYEIGNDKNIAIGCRVFGTAGDRTGKGTHEYYNVFDGDLYTSFDYKEPSGGWSAVDLKKTRYISEISYSPRNRDNYIRKGDTYELFFWNNSNCQWNSLGKKIANSDELVYNVPKGALLYLKNHSRGVNERVFEYDSQKNSQIFH